MDYREIDFVCLRPDGCFESSSTVGIACRTASKKIPGLEGFRFHQLRHTFTSNLLSNGAAPKGRAGAFGTRRRQYHHEHLRSLDKGKRNAHQPACWIR